MPLVPISPPPGVCLSATSYASGKDGGSISAGAGSFRQGGGRWIDATNVEFVAGLPQKIAGWSQITASTTIDIPRAAKIWRDNTGGARIGIGTETHLYYLLGTALTDITPLRVIIQGTLTDPVSITNGSNLIEIDDASQNLKDLDWVFLSAASAVGNILLNGWYQVSGRTGSGYNVTFPISATSTAGPGGGTVNFSYPRVTLTDPFTTVMGSAIVTAHHVASGASAGGYVNFSDAAAVGGLTLNGEYQIATIVDADNYTINAGSLATSAASGGGSVSVTYDIIIQQSTAQTGVGYGQGNYGVGAYGVGIVSTAVPHNGWTLDAYGSQLVAAPIGGTIYIYDPAFGGRAYPMQNAPASLLAMFVTPERFVVALGVNDNLLQMAWCDQSNYTVWTTTPTNTANSGRTLIGGSYFVGGIGIRDGVSLIFTDRCVFQMNYTGGQEIYSTPQIGDNCGLVDPTSVVTEGGVAYWQSDQDFWSWNGGVSVLPTDDIRAYVFQSGSGVLNRQYLTTCTASLNRAKRQARFWFPGSGSVENNMGVAYHYDQQCFSLLGFGKSCGQDAELLPVPVSADTNRLIYFDESGVDANGVALPYQLELSEMDISNGDRVSDVFGFIPDTQTQSGTMSLLIKTTYNSPAATFTFGPYDLAPGVGRQDLRADGKTFGFVLQADALGANFRLGVPRLDVQPGGARA